MHWQTIAKTMDNGIEVFPACVNLSSRWLTQLGLNSGQLVRELDLPESRFNFKLWVFWIFYSFWKCRIHVWQRQIFCLWRLTNTLRSQICCYNPPGAGAAKSRLVQVLTAVLARLRAAGSSKQFHLPGTYLSPASPISTSCHHSPTCSAILTPFSAAFSALTKHHP